MYLLEPERQTTAELDLRIVCKCIYRLLQEMGAFCFKTERRKGNHNGKIPGKLTL